MSIESEIENYALTVIGFSDPERWYLKNLSFTYTEDSISASGEFESVSSDIQDFSILIPPHIFQQMIGSERKVVAKNHRSEYSEILEDVLGAMQGYQKASGSDRADWDFSDEIEQIEELLQ